MKDKELLGKLRDELYTRQSELLKQYNRLILSICRIVGKFFNLDPIKKKNGFFRPSFGTKLARIIFAIVPKFGRRYLRKDINFIDYLIIIIEDRNC